jgi:hypothetical protein
VWCILRFGCGILRICDGEVIWRGWGGGIWGDCAGVEGEVVVERRGGRERKRCEGRGEGAGRQEEVLYV